MTNRTTTEFDLDQDTIKIVMLSTIKRFGNQRILDDFLALVDENKTLEEAFVGSFISPEVESILEYAIAQADLDTSITESE